MSFKTFDLAHDVASLVSAVNEVVVVSSSLYTTGSGDLNVKFYTNIASGTGDPSRGGYWETVYDSSPASPQSTALFDLSFGFASTSSYNVPVASGGLLPDEKVKVYRQMASVLLGSSDSIFSPGGAVTWPECFFILFKRGLMKDELKKGSISINVLPTTGETGVTASDIGAATSFKQTVGGDYAPLLNGSSSIGLVYYNAGVAVLPVSGAGIPWNSATAGWSGSSHLVERMTAGTIDSLVDGLRAHLGKITFHNQTNLYSTVYFCRATNTEFNYSSNPTYVDENKRIRVTSGSNVLQSRTYITTIGLYDANDNLLAVGKVNKPITKSPDTESIFRIRLDY